MTVTGPGDWVVKGPVADAGRCWEAFKRVSLGVGGWAGSRGRGRFLARQDAEESILQKQPQPKLEDQTRMRARV